MFKITTITAILGSGATLIFGTITPLFYVLIGGIALDVFTGVMKGFYRKELRSRHMAQGAIRKILIFVALIMGNLIDIAMFTGLPVASTAITSYFIAMELLSVTENLAQMDVPLPSFVKNTLLVLKEKSETIEEKPNNKTE